MNSLIQKIRRSARRIGPSRPVHVSIAGEDYVVDSGSSLATELDDKDYAWLRELSKGKRCILDVGCSMGLSALMFARHMDPSGECVLFDGSINSLRQAASNIFAAGPPTPKVSFAYSWVGKGSGNPSAAPDLIRFDSGLVVVQSALRRLPGKPPPVGLDEICLHHGLRPDFVKIDIEGAEHDALEGSEWLSSEARPIFQVELHSFRLTMEDAGSRIIEWSARSGYEPWYLKHHARLESPEPLKDRGRCHVLLLPSGTPYPESLRSIPQGIANVLTV